MAAPGTVKCARTFSLRSLHIGENSYSENFEIAHSIPIQTELIELTSFQRFVVYTYPWPTYEYVL